MRARVKRLTGTGSPGTVWPERTGIAFVNISFFASRLSVLNTSGDLSFAALLLCGLVLYEYLRCENWGGGP